jgi:DNA-binding transcriptional MerR regulator
LTELNRGHSLSPIGHWEESATSCALQGKRKLRYTISQFANSLGISASAVRYYEQQGLLPKAPRLSGQRVYHSEDMPALRLIVAMRKAGLSLAEIRDFLSTRESPGFPRAAALQKLKAKIGSIDQKICLLEEQRTALEHALRCPCEDISRCQRLIDFVSPQAMS